MGAIKIPSNDTGISHLTTGFCVERSLIEDYSATFAFFQNIDFLMVLYDADNYSLRPFCFVTKKFRCPNLFTKLVPNAFFRSLSRARPRRPSPLPLLLHRVVEAGNIDVDLASFQSILSQIEWEPKCIIQIECYIPRQDRSPRFDPRIFHRRLNSLPRFNLRDSVIEDREPTFQRTTKTSSSSLRVSVMWACA